MPNTHSYRVIQDRHHLLFLNRLQWAYTTSANLSNENYNEKFAKESADIVIEPLNDTIQSSNIYRLGKQNY